MGSSLFTVGYPALDQEHKHCNRITVFSSFQFSFSNEEKFLHSIQGHWEWVLDKLLIGSNHEGPLTTLKTVNRVVTKRTGLYSSSGKRLCHGLVRPQKLYFSKNSEWSRNMGRNTAFVCSWHIYTDELVLNTYHPSSAAGVLFITPEHFPILADACK